MQVLELHDVTVEGVYSCLPKRCEDTLSACTRLSGDAAKAAGIVKTTGIRSRRLAAPGVTSLDLCVEAARTLLTDASVCADQIGGIVFVTFTPANSMPCNACQAQARLQLGGDIVAFDVSLACSGYAYGLYLAGTLARATGKKILLLDGDVQSAVLRPDDAATVPVLADAGTATLVALGGSDCWKFSFLSDGLNGGVLKLPFGGTISMDGFAVYRFVATEVSAFLKQFMAEVGLSAADVDAFVPHQANCYLIRQLAAALGFSPDKLLVSADEVGNSASATVPVTISRKATGRRSLLVSGFGGGLSASAGMICLPSDVLLKSFDSQQ